MIRELSGLFEPKSITIIGASTNPSKLGSIVLKNIILSGFNGNIYPVNPNVSHIAGVKFYAKVDELPEIPDLAVVAIPAEAVVTVIEEIGKFGIKNVVIFSAGFKEIGEEGNRLEKQLIETANKYEINILGPNCLGFAMTNPSLNVTFGQINKKKGNLKLISQSGALAASLFDWCETTGLGFSDFVTVGNKSILNENDVLEYWLPQLEISSTPANLEESNVTPVGLYLESIADGKKISDLLQRITPHNPVFLLKPGKSVQAAGAMHSHTGAIAGEDKVFEAFIKNSGAIRCHELGDFFDLAMSFAWENAPNSDAVAVISNAGGPAVLTTDTIIEEGLTMAKLSEEATIKLKEKMPRMASIINPVDVIGDALADRFGEALEIVLQEESVGSVIVLLTPQLMTQIEKTAEIIGEKSKKYPKPIFVSFIGGNKTEIGRDTLNNHKIPNFDYPERAVKAIARMWEWQKKRNEKRIISNEKNELKIDEIGKALEAKDNQMVLELMEIPVPPAKIVYSIQEAREFAVAMGWPVVMKIISPEILHKADVGGVITNIRTEVELQESFGKMKGFKGQIQMQKQVGPGIEIIVGFKQDPSFGAVMLIGAGGKYAEILNDHQLTPANNNRDDLVRSVTASKVYKLLSGYRDDPAYNLDTLYDIMQKLSLLANEFPEIKEMEINPLIIGHDGMWAVDPKIVVERKNKGPNFKMAKVISNKILAGKFREIFLEANEPLGIVPGQYISVKVANTRINSYSVAGIDKNNEFELLVDTSPGGPGSQFFENLKENESINFLGPFGNFKLKTDDGSNQIIFMATGSGIAPLKFMIKNLLIEQKFDKKICLYLGLRHEDDIFWWREFDDLAKEYSNFEFRLCLSKPADSWTGDRGHITELLAKDFPDGKEISAYLCGNKSMIDEAQNILIKANCQPNHIYYEKFD